MKYKLSLLLLIFILLFTGCEEKNTNNSYKNIKNPQKPFNNSTIMVLVPTLHADLVRGPIIKEAKEFEKNTGAKIRVVTPSWSETIKSINKSVESPKEIIYDIYTVIGLWNGTLLKNDNLIAQVPNKVLNKINWDDVLPIYKNNILKWNNKVYALPYDGDNISLYYRKDIFENKEYKKKFYKEYGYELSYPKTWKHYKDAAKFFNGWDWDNDGKIEYGNAGLRIKNDVSLLQFFAQAAAYAKHPNDPSYYFDTNTMKARIANEAFVKALDDYIELINYGPKGMQNFAGQDVRDAFVKGEVALAIDWADLGIYAVNAEHSVVKQKIGFGLLPGSEEVFNCTSHKWEKIFNQPSSISGNWIMFVNKNSKNIDLAFEFAAHMTSTQTTKKYVVDPTSAVNPSRYSHLNDQLPWEKAGFSKELAQKYIKVIDKSLKNKNVVVDILIPAGELYYQALDSLIYDAVQGKISSKDALQKAALKWEEITDTIGRDIQKEYYIKSLNIDKQ